MKRMLKLTMAVVAMLAVACFSVACDGSASPSKPSVIPSASVSTAPSAAPSTTPTEQPSVTPTTGTNPSVTPSTGTNPTVTPTTGTNPTVTPSTGNPPQGAEKMTEQQFYAALDFSNLTGVTLTYNTAITANNPAVEAPVPADSTTLLLNGNKLQIVSAASTYPMTIESAEGAIYLYVDSGEELMGAMRLDLIGMLEDPIVAEMVNGYLDVDYGAMLIQYAAAFEDEGFTIQGAMQEIVSMCESVEYDLKALVHTLMEAYGLEEPDIAEYFEGVDLGEMLTSLGVAPAAAQTIVEHFEENGFNLDALLDLLVLNGFDLEAKVTEIDEFLASFNYSAAELMAYLVDSIGMTDETLGSFLGKVMGANAPLTYEALIGAMDLENLPATNWTDALALETAFDYDDYDVIEGAYVAEAMLDPATGLAVTESLRFAEGKIAEYTVSLITVDYTFGYKLLFSDYNETEVTVPTEYTEVTLEDLLSSVPGDPGSSSSTWAEQFDLENYTATIQVSTNYLGTTQTVVYDYAETLDNWAFSANNFAWGTDVHTTFEAYGDWYDGYVNGALDPNANAIPSMYTSILSVCAYFEGDFAATGEFSYYAAELTDFSTVTGGGYDMTIEDIYVTVADGHVSSLRYTAIIDMSGTTVNETWNYTFTDVNQTVIATPSYAQ